MQDPKQPVITDPVAAPASPKKPRSPQQIAASLSNGKKSKGPTTPQGRLKCSVAARSQFKHQQLAETVLITGESRSTFTGLLQRYIDTFQPMTEPEHNVIQKMVVAYWHHLRSWSTHQTGFNCEIARQDSNHPPNVRASEAEQALTQTGNVTLQHASRNQAALDRQFRNGMRDLILLRKLRGVTTGLEPIPIPIASSVWEHPQDDDEVEP